MKEKSLFKAGNMRRKAKIFLTKASELCKLNEKFMLSFILRKLAKKQ